MILSSCILKKWNHMTSPHKHSKQSSRQEGHDSWELMWMFCAPVNIFKFKHRSRTKDSSSHNPTEVSHTLPLFILFYSLLFVYTTQSNQMKEHVYITVLHTLTFALSCCSEVSWHQIPTHIQTQEALIMWPSTCRWAHCFSPAHPSHSSKTEKLHQHMRNLSTSFLQLIYIILHTSMWSMKPDETQQRERNAIPARNI